MDYRYRFLSSSLGRFIQPDPVIPEWTNPQSLNRYAYAYNSPVNYNDPTGHIANWVIGGLVGGFANTAAYIVNEIKHGDGLDKKDIGDVATSFGMGAAAGALIATPGLQAAGIAMAGSLISNHAGNSIHSENFDAVDHAVTGVVGGGLGYTGAWYYTQFGVGLGSVMQFGTAFTADVLHGGIECERQNLAGDLCSQQIGEMGYTVGDGLVYQVTDHLLPGEILGEGIEIALDAAYETYKEPSNKGGGISSTATNYLSLGGGGFSPNSFTHHLFE